MIRRLRATLLLGLLLAAAVCLPSAGALEATDVAADDAGPLGDRAEPALACELVLAAPATVITRLPVPPVRALPGRDFVHDVFRPPIAPARTRNPS